MNVNSRIARAARVRTPSLRRSLRKLRCSAAFMFTTLAGSAAVFPGCAASPDVWEQTVHNDTCRVDAISAQVDVPLPPVVQQVAHTMRPTTVRTIDEASITYVDRTLADVLQAGLQYSTVLRDLGGVVLRSPDTVDTTLATQIRSTDPRFGDEAALSQFDAQLSASAMFENNDRIFNNAFFAGGATAFQQDLHDYNIELSKINATGGRMALRGVAEYDANNAPANTFPSAFQNFLEGELRQPLLQGGGAEFNRIAGPNARPGLYNGILIARVGIDVEQAEFEANLRDYVSNVENAYWDLYLAYRKLDARKKAAERALVIWNETKEKLAAELIAKSREALARQQYFRLKAEVDEALSGRLLSGTQTRNGSDGGTLQQTGGVLSAERRLRLLIGLPASDGQLIRTASEPTMAEVPVDWDTSVQEAIAQRPELRRQHLRVKQREMELLAAKNFLNPRLDAVGRYRFRGFGDDFIDHSGTQRGAAPSSSTGNLFTGDQQEWMVGVELNMPIGFRQAHAAVANAELQLSRARMIQVEQQREVISNLSAAVTDADRAYQAMQNNLNRFLAAQEYFDALIVQKEEKGLDVEPDRFLDAQERLVRSEVDFFLSRSEYAVALKNIQYEKGTLLAYKDVLVAGEGQLMHTPLLPASGSPGEFLPPPVDATWDDDGAAADAPAPLDEDDADAAGESTDGVDDTPPPPSESDEPPSLDVPELTWADEEPAAAAGVAPFSLTVLPPAEDDRSPIVMGGEDVESDDPWTPAAGRTDATAPAVLEFDFAGGPVGQPQPAALLPATPSNDAATHREPPAVLDFSFDPVAVEGPIVPIGLSESPVAPESVATPAIFPLPQPQRDRMIRFEFGRPAAATPTENESEIAPPAEPVTQPSVESQPAAADAATIRFDFGG